MRIKKLTAIFLALLTVVALSGCGLTEGRLSVDEEVVATLQPDEVIRYEIITDEDGNKVIKRDPVDQNDATESAEEGNGEKPSAETPSEEESAPESEEQMPSRPAETPVTSQEQTTVCKSHSYSSWVTVKDSTCVSVGSKQRKCTACSATETQTIEKKTTHTFSSWSTVKNASCAVAGSKQRKCTVTGCTKTETQTIAATGNHSYSSWTTNKPATCSAAGSKSRSCTGTGCNKTETQPIAATGNHSYNTKGYCSSCSSAHPGSTFLNYRLSSDGTYYICTGTSSYTKKDMIVIPATYNGKPVKEVGTGSPSFCDCKVLVIREGVETVKAQAFYFSQSLQSVTLPSSLEYIGYGAFDYCDNLEAVYISTSGWKSIKKYGSATASVDFSNPYTTAEILREKSFTTRYER